jgi:cytochrome P450
LSSVNTSTVSLVTVYYLIKYSRYQAALYKELFDSGKFDMGLSTPLLDACIYEAMRLQAVVPHGGERNTPPEGLQIGEHWIPGGVIIRVPMYTMFRGSYS